MNNINTKTLEALKESEEKYRLLFDNSNDAIVIIQDGMVKFHNLNTCKFVGYSNEEIAGIPFINLVHPDDRQTVMERHIRRLSGEIFSPTIYAFRVLNKDNQVIWGEVNAVRVKWEGRNSVLCFIRDITKRKKTEFDLLTIQRELEKRVEERTKELENINRDLETKTANLLEANTAFKVVLNKREEDKLELEDKVMFNVKGLIMPYIEKLEESNLNGEQKENLELIKANLNDIASPLGQKLSSGYLMFTPTEIKVANLIKHGKASKEIAKVLNLSEKTIQFHRQNIRKKLGIKNKKVNLRIHLMSFR